MLEDKLLIWKLNRGSMDALRRIYEKYRDDLLGLAAALLNEKTAAEDIVHDVFLTFVRSAGSFQLHGSLRAYLAVCVANRARNINKSRARRAADGLDNGLRLPSQAPAPEQWLIIGEQFAQVAAALAQLPYEQREAVLLHLHGQMKFRQIAALQSVSTKTAQSRFRYGIDKLRSLLNSEVIK